MLACDLIRRVIHDAAMAGGVAPDRVPFTNTLRVVGCRRPESPGVRAAVWYREVLLEVRRLRLRPRRERWCPRVVKRKMSDWGKKRAEHLRPPRPTKPNRQTVVVLI
jgi:hypothetical protein